MFKNLLDPHSEKALRKALDTLDLSLPDQRQALAHLVLENQGKLTESKLLDEIADSKTLFEISLNAESPMQQRLSEQLRQSLSSNIPEQVANNKILLEKFINPLNSKAVLHFSTLCEHEALFIQAIASLTLTEKIHLIGLLKNDQLKEIILCKITDIETLKNLEKSFGNKDKRTYRLIQDRIESIEKERKTEEEFKSRCQKLLNGIEALAKSSFAPLYDSKLKHLLDEWKTLNHELENAKLDINKLIDQVAKERFDKFSQICKQVIEEHKHAEEVEEQNNQNSIFLEGALKKLENFISTSPYQREACEALKSSINEKLGKGAIPEAFDKTRYKLLCDVMDFQNSINSEAEFFENLEKSINSLQELFQSNHKKKKAAQDTLKNINDLSDQLKEIRKQFPEIDIEPDGKRLIKEKLNALNSLKSQCLSTQDEFRSKFDKKTGYVKSEFENKALNTVERLCREAEELIPYCREDQQENLQKRLLIHKEELGQLEDWFNFATLPKRKELLEKMEGLARRSKQMKIKLLKDEIKDIQQQWRELGHARDDEGKALWEKFKKQGDLAYQPVQLLIDKKESEKQSNLEKRKKILEKLKQHIEAITLSPPKDWGESEKILKRSEKEWQEAFPIPSGNQDLQQSFNQQLEALNTLLIPQRKVNQGKKKSLIDNANLLLKLDNNKEAIDKVKELQHEWKLIGLADDEQVLWESFREICDQIFKQRDQIKEEQQSKEKQAIKAGQKISLTLENIDSSNASEFESEMRKLVSQFDEIRDIPKNRNDIFKQFNRARKNAEKQLHVLKQNNQAQVFEKLLSLCQSLAPIEQEIISSTNVEQNIESALNMITTSEIDENYQNKILEHIKALDKAINKDEFIKNANEILRETCISLEIETDCDSPSQDKNLRMQIQVKRLNEKFNSKRDDSTLEQKITNAFLTGGLYSYMDSSYSERLLKLFKQSQQKVNLS